MALIDPTPNEIRALGDATGAAGSYIEGVAGDDPKRFDFTTWSPEEFDGLVETIVAAYIDSLQAARHKETERTRSA